MYELKGKTSYYLIVVVMWYMMVVLLCTTGSNEMYLLGTMLGVLPYVVIGCIILLCGVEKVIKWCIMDRYKVGYMVKRVGRYDVCNHGHKEFKIVRIAYGGCELEDGTHWSYSYMDRWFKICTIQKNIIGGEIL